MTRLSKQEIEALIPHSGTMCLIDSVEKWSHESILCRTRSHLDNNNPLLINNELNPIHLLEYGAQAMAIHSGLISRTSIHGYLAALSNARFHIFSLQDIQCDLLIEANSLLTSERGAIYEYTIYCLNNTLIKAQGTVINTLQTKTIK